MRLYVKDYTGKKIYLNALANSRKELAQKMRNRKVVIQSRVYDVNDIIAEDETDNTTNGAIVGTLLGVLGGPIGIAVGALGGLLIGSNMTTSETTRVENFNNTFL